MVEVSVILLTDQQLRESIKKCRDIPVPDPTKPSLLQGVIRNMTQFGIRINGDPYFYSGRYEEPPPSSIEAFKIGTFTATSHQPLLPPLQGATGGNAWKLQINHDIEFHFALGFTRPSLGSNKAAILESTSPKQAYDAANEHGNAITSTNLYTGGDEHGNEISIRFYCSAAVNSPLRVYEIEQVINH